VGVNATLVLKKGCAMSTHELKVAAPRVESPSQGLLTALRHLGIDPIDSARVERIKLAARYGLGPDVSDKELAYVLEHSSIVPGVTAEFDLTEYRSLRWTERFVYGGAVPPWLDERVQAIHSLLPEARFTVWATQGDPLVFVRLKGEEACIGGWYLDFFKKYRIV
jgi:hypothetical protein